MSPGLSQAKLPLEVKFVVQIEQSAEKASSWLGSLGLVW